MVEIKVHFKQLTYIAILNDDLSKIVASPKNQATYIVDGVASELGIWSIYFGDEIEADFICLTDENGDEQKSLIPAEILLWGKNGKAENTDLIEFSVEINKF